MRKKTQTNCILIASNFVIHPQTLIFSVFKIANLSPYWLQIKFSMSLFFYLFTFAINLWHRKFVTADVTAVFVNINMVLSDEDKILIKTFVFEGVHSKEVERRISWESWTKRGANKLFKKLRDTCTVDRRPSSDRPKKTLSFFLANVNSRSRSLYAVARPSVVCLSSVCNVRAPYSGGSDFRQYFYGIRYLGYPLASTENFMEIVQGKPLRRGN